MLGMGALPTRVTPPSERHEPGFSDRWQIECILDLEPVEIGLTRQQAHADALVSPASTPLLMLWRSQPALLVSRPETRLPRFEAARAQLQAAGWPVLLRKSGGGACPVGPGTVQASTIELAPPVATINAKYAALAELIHSALELYGVEVLTGLGRVDKIY